MKMESDMKFPFTVYTAHHGYDWSNIPDGFSEGSLKKLEQIVTASKPEYMNDGERFEGIIYAQAHLVVFSAMRVPNWDYSNRTSLYYAFAFLPRQECKKVNIDLLLRSDAFVRPSKAPLAEVEYIGGPSALAPESIVAEFKSGSPTVQGLDFSYCGELLCENGQIAEKWWIFRTVGTATDGSRVVFEKNKFMFASSKPKPDVPTSGSEAGAACNSTERRNISLSYSAGDDPLARLEMKFANALKVIRKERESDAAAIRTLVDKVGKIIVALGVVVVANLLTLGFFVVKAGAVSKIFCPTPVEQQEDGQEVSGQTSDSGGETAATNETKNASGRKGRKPISDAKKASAKSGKNKHEETTK